ncbi:MarR family transcriptional regulator [Melissococcus plutonius]|uniref:Transcriptional regulator, MarR family n=2 Tax=Melissococcus plutonius TaxID=33970 RepID=F3Y8K8_MELPT|nr:MarR family transcriptional regulator [Melissococcus plutonius]BAL62741.1 MarR family transcriptional regulator [Melissococcus plutonius DAT561]AIM25534.1 MarR family transcriptional regulator [Melissococcus plutonius S1]KMT24582.1 MarR family transcriptional regulator [Melissococcus plutonius]KMT27295.1 MarR family transcriptional regulator [Melissococcus plutonius]KMT27468.1 MarR family transcriptional regulator [Melissococcus plutonius]
MADEQKDLGYEIRELAILFGRRIKKEACKRKIKKLMGPQAMVLNFIYYNPEKIIYQKDIEKELSIRKSTASQLLDRMEANGYVHRIVSNKDKRLKQIILTKKALEQKQAINEMTKQIEKELMKDLSAEEVDAFLKTVNKIKNNLN